MIDSRKHKTHQRLLVKTIENAFILTYSEKYSNVAACIRENFDLTALS